MGPRWAPYWLLIGRERSRAGGTSGDVTSGKRPLTSGKKWIVGSRWVKTADQWKKSIVGKNRGPGGKIDRGLRQPLTS